MTRRVFGESRGLSDEDIRDVHDACDLFATSTGYVELRSLGNIIRALEYKLPQKDWHEYITDLASRGKHSLTKDDVVSLVQEIQVSELVRMQATQVFEALTGGIRNVIDVDRLQAISREYSLAFSEEEMVQMLAGINGYGGNLVAVSDFVRTIDRGYRLQRSQRREEAKDFPSTADKSPA